MSSEHDIILRSLEDGVLTITLNRPDRLNTITGAVTTQLNVILTEAASDAAVRAVVLTGAGAAFCAGGDMEVLAEEEDARQDAQGPRPALVTAAENSNLLHSMSKPTIAMIRGPAAGGGLALAAACDLRIASETARFAYAYTKIGLAGDYGANYFLQKILGYAKAREFCLLSPKIDAAEALRIGLVHRVVPDSALETEALGLAHSFAEGPPLAYAGIKANLDAATRATMNAAFEAEIRNFLLCRDTADHKEAVQAFIGRRPAKFIGR